MGSFVSKAKGHFVRRNIQRFNIESRTEKLLAKEKPIPSPRFPADQEFIEDLHRNAPNIRREVRSIDNKFSERLKKVYVTSEDPDPELYTLDRHVKTQNPERPLPVRVPIGFNPSKPTRSNPLELKDGRLTLSQISDLLLDYKTSHPSISALEEKYGTKNNIYDLVSHYKIFDKFDKEDDIPQVSKNPLLPGPDWEEAKPK